MKKIKTVLIVLLIVIMTASVALLAVGCKGKEKPEEKLQPAADDFSYYPDLPVTASKKLFVVKGTDMTQNEQLVVTAIQGLVARTGSEIYIEAQNDMNTAEKPDMSGYTLYLNDLVENYGYTIEYVKSDSDGRAVDKIVKKYRDIIVDSGIVVYTAAADVSEDTLNVATTICSAEGWLPVEAELVAKATMAVDAGGWGFTIKQDLRELDNGAMKNEEWAFAKYKDKLTKKILIHQDPQKVTLRDYGIATKAFTFFNDRLDSPNFITDVYNWADKDIPIMGWCEDELAYVALNSGFSKITIGADWSNNLSMLSSVKALAPIKQNEYKAETVTPTKGKHYMAMVMSDGDNIQWVQSGFMNDTKYFGSEFRGDFKLTWGINPSMSDLAPNIMQKVYNESTPKDEFITGVSGNGYINPTQYQSLNDYVSRTNAYMKRSDLKYVDLLDNGVETKAIKPYGDMPNIGGGVWKVGNKYVEGHGAVYWANEKPFITFRESMWGESSASILALANRINNYQTDPTKIEGYSLINIHPWTHSMSDVKKFTTMLDEDVVIVTAGELIEMVKANVEHKDVPKLEEANIPPVETPDYVLPGVTESDLTLLSPTNDKEFNSGNIGTKWNILGSTAAHGEGFCFEVVTPQTDISSFIYNKFAITPENNKLSIKARAFVRPGETYSDLGVRVVDGSTTTVIRAIGNPNTPAGEWVVIDKDAPLNPTYDLSAYDGKTIVIAIGTRKGNHCAVSEIKLMPMAAKVVWDGVTLDDLVKLPKATSNSFTQNATLKEIAANWAVKAAHHAELGEGYDLQFAGQIDDVNAPMNSFVYNKIGITSSNKTLTVKARTFTGQNGPEAGGVQYIPYLYLQVADAQGNVTIVPVTVGDAKVDTDTYKSFAYDLTAFEGQDIYVAIGIGRGYHCVISEIKFA